MTLVPGMTKNGKAFLTLHVNGQPVGQWSPDDARGHASGMLDSIAVIALDDGYLKVLTERLEVDEAAADGQVPLVRQPPCSVDWMIPQMHHAPR